MALIKVSGLITGLSGKLGGSILGTSLHGSYIKQNSYSQQHATPAQSLQRTQLYPINQIWRTLSSTQQTAWNDKTTEYPYTNRVGDTAYYTGYQLFCICNQYAMLTLNSVFLSPTAKETEVNPIFVAGVVDATQINLSYSASTTITTFLLYGSPQRTDNLIPHKSKFRSLGFENTYLATGSINLYSKYTNRFGSIATGERLYFYIKPINQNSSMPSPDTDILRVDVS